MKKIVKSVKIRRNYGDESVAPFLCPTVYRGTTACKLAIARLVAERADIQRTESEQFVSVDVGTLTPLQWTSLECNIEFDDCSRSGGRKGFEPAGGMRSAGCGGPGQDHYYLEAPAHPEML